MKITEALLNFKWRCRSSFINHEQLEWESICEDAETAEKKESVELEKVVTRSFLETDVEFAKTGPFNLVLNVLTEHVLRLFFVKCFLITHFSFTSLSSFPITSTIISFTIHSFISISPSVWGGNDVSRDYFPYYIHFDFNVYEKMFCSHQLPLHL